MVRLERLRCERTSERSDGGPEGARPTGRVIPLSPPTSLVSVLRLRRTGPIQQEFRTLGHIQEAEFSAKPNSWMQNFHEMVICLKRQNCEFGYDDSLFMWTLIACMDIHLCSGLARKATEAGVRML